MAANSFTKAYKKGSDSLNALMQGCLVFSVILYLITNGPRAMQFMFIMVRALQMILHLPMMTVLFPANVLTIIEIMIPTIGFDILDNFFDWEKQSILQFDFEKHERVGEEIFS